MGLSEKLLTKMKYVMNPHKKSEKIKRSIDRERVKQRIGQRIFYQNQQILDDMRGNKTSHHKKTGSVGVSGLYSIDYWDGGDQVSQLSKSSFPRSTMQDSYVPK